MYIYVCMYMCLSADNRISIQRIFSSDSFITSAMQHWIVTGIHDDLARESLLHLQEETRNPRITKRMHIAHLYISTYVEGL